ARNDHQQGKNAEMSASPDHAHPQEDWDMLAAQVAKPYVRPLRRHSQTRTSFRKADMLFWAASLPVISSLRPAHGIALAATVEPRSHTTAAGTAGRRGPARGAGSHVVARPWRATPSGARQAGARAPGS